MNPVTEQRKRTAAQVLFVFFVSFEKVVFASASFDTLFNAQYFAEQTHTQRTKTQIIAAVVKIDR